MAKSIKVIERKMGREKAVGMAFEHDEIHIDPRQTAKEECDTYIHEVIHLIFPNWKERKVAATARKISSFLWKQGFRRVKLK